MATDSSLDLCYPPFSDFKFFYGASRCVLYGQSPYFNECSIPVTPDAHAPFRMVLRYPPHGLWLVSPLGLTDFFTSAIIFTAFSLAILLVSIPRLIRSLNINSEFTAVRSLLFFPAVKTLWFGQLSIVFLAIALLGSTVVSTPLLSGIWLSIGMIKPNLFIPLIAFFIAMRGCQRTKLFLGLAIGGALQAVLAWIFIPNFLSDLLNLNAPWWQFEPVSQPTVAYQFFSSSSWARQAIFSAGIVLCVLLGRMVKSGTDATRYIPLVLAISVLCSPYIWVHDQVFLLPAAFALFPRVSVLSIIFWSFLLYLGYALVICDSGSESIFVALSVCITGLAALRLKKC